MPGVVPVLTRRPNDTSPRDYRRDCQRVGFQLGRDTILDEGPVSVERIVGRGDYNVRGGGWIEGIQDQVPLVSEIFRKDGLEMTVSTGYTLVQMSGIAHIVGDDLVLIIAISSTEDDAALATVTTCVDCRITFEV